MSCITAPVKYSISTLVMHVAWRHFLKLNQMTIIVTGASRGIGASIATELARQQANIVVNYNTNQALAEAVVETIQQAGGTALAIQADLSKQDAVNHLYEQSLSRYGQVDAVVHNATPALLTADALNATYSDIQFYMDVYVGAFLRLAQLTLPGMIERRFGRFIAISTSLVSTPAPKRLAYITAKSAMQGFIRSLAVDYGAFGIRANTIMASLIPTDLVAEMGERAMTKAAQSNIVKRLANPQDVASAVRYLLDESGDFITGSVLPITGGEVLT